MSEADVVVVSVARTPFGKFEGVLRGLDGAALGALAIDACLGRSGVPPAAVDSLYGGVGMLASAMLTPVRQAVLSSSLPETTPSATIDRACCSGMTAIGMGFRDILLGEASVVLCGGFESLSHTPLLWPRQRAQRLGDVCATDPLLIRGRVVEQPIAVYTGDEALRHGVSREDQDVWAVESHRRYTRAQAEGYFDFERFTVEAPGAKGDVHLVHEDESPRPDTSIEKLARLSPVYGGKTVTAGNAPGLNDGAAFVMLCRRDFAQAHGLEVLARIVDYAQVSGAPTSGTSTPAHAIARLADRNAVDACGWDAIEINEAYAATPLVSTLALADDNITLAEQLRSRTNIHGGAVALGHPLGASGTRIVMTLINALRKRGGGRGVAAICGGFGQGDGMLITVD